MKNKTIGAFFKKDPFLAIGSVIFPLLLMGFTLWQKSLAEEIKGQLLSMNETFVAIMFSALAILLAIIIGVFISDRLQTQQNDKRLFLGFLIGGISSAIATISFILIMR